MNWRTLLLAAALATNSALGQTVASIAGTPQHPVKYMYEKEVPLHVFILGNSTYDSAAPILNAALDAKMMDEFFKRRTESVVTRFNLNRKSMLDEIDAFAAKLTPGDIAVVFYAGHGIQHAGNNYLVPTDAKNENLHRLGTDNVGLHYLLDTLAGKDIGTGMVILDACRTNPFFERYGLGRGLERQDGLAASKAPPGMLIAYATGPGKVSWSGDDPKKNSLYSRSLASWVPKEGLPVETLFKRVRSEVLKLSENAQQPWEESSLTGDLTLRPSKQDLARHRTDWMNALELANRDDIQEYITNNPASRFVHAARLWLQEKKTPNASLPTFAFAPIAGVLRAASTQSYDRLQIGELAVVAESRVPIHAKPDASSSIIGFLEAGEIATMVDSANRMEWSRVTQKKFTGPGYINGVEHVGTPGNVLTTARIASSGTPTATPSAAVRNMVSAYEQALKIGNAGILLRPYATDEESPARARSLALSHALALKVSLSRQGIDSRKVAVQLPTWTSIKAQRSGIDVSLIGSKGTARLTVPQ